MKVYTDSAKYADSILVRASWQQRDATSVPSEIKPLFAAVFAERPVYETEVWGGAGWPYLLIAETSDHSQYDLLIELRREGMHLPDGVLCLCGEGRGLHGLRQRPWAAEAGNIHLSVHLAPDRLVTSSGIPFMVLAAISVIDTIDSLSGLSARAGIKWVNDILLEGAKVAGVLAYTEGSGKAIDAAVLGIGLNVETTPEVPGTLFVPHVGSLRDFVSDSSTCTNGSVLERLAAFLADNYRQLLAGRSEDLIDRYRDRSIAIGKYVTVYVDDVSGSEELIAKGEVTAIGDNLELSIAGRRAPVTRGRLVLGSEI